jgi:uncharacterized protein YjbI with pentapeptide repeats
MSKRSLPKVKTIRRLLKWGIVILSLVAVLGLLQPSLWPGGFGIGKEQSVTTKSVEIVVKDAQGNTTKTVETTKNDDGKTLWDWLSLLGVPLSLAVLGYVLQQLQQKRAEILAKEQREIAADETKEEVLQVYFDRISVLLVDKNLLAIAGKVHTSKVGGEEGTPKNNASTEEQELLDSAVDVIRARTLSILRRFEGDPERKTSVIRFLSESDIVSKLKLNLDGVFLRSTNLSGANLSYAFLIRANLSYANLSYAFLSHADLISANLSYANLSGAFLSGADLSGADLSHANLSHATLIDAKLNCADLSHATFGANLSRANLSHAKLSGATLEGFDLSGAKLSGAKLSGADLNGANLSGADLRDAKLNGARLDKTNLCRADLRDAVVTIEQLQKAKLCQTMLSKGMPINPNRNCKELGISEN